MHSQGIATPTWQADLLKNMHENDGYPAIVRHYREQDPCTRWQFQVQPARNASGQLDLAFKVALGDFDHPYVRVFLDFAERVIARIQREDPVRWEDSGFQGWGGGLLHLNRLEVAEVTELLRAFNGNAELETATIAEAARGLVAEYLPNRKGHDWTEMDQSDLLRAVIWLLHAGCADEARAALRHRKSYVRTQRMHDWVKALTLAWPDAPGKPSSQDFATLFDRIYDVVRQPDARFFRLGNESSRLGLSFSTGDQCVFAVVLAIIRRKWIEQQPLAGHWRDMFARIAAAPDEADDQQGH